MAPTETPLLEVRDLSVSYGHIRALRGVSLVVHRGETVVLIGSNGAGKSTLLSTVLGLCAPTSGEVLYKGRSVVGQSVDRIVRSGICLVPEGGGVFATMTVLDNLLLGSHNDPRAAPGRLEQVFGWFPVLSARRGQIANTLSGGERQMLAIGRALMSQPELILVDEPSIGLAPKVVSDIFRIIEMLEREGYTILLSEQNVRKALACAARGYVLETGRVALSGTAANLALDPRVRSAYLGA